MALNTEFLPNRKSYARISDVLKVPNLIQIQLNSFRWFQEEGLKELLTEISPIKDFTGTRLELTFLNPNEGPGFGQPQYEFRQPKYSEEECRERDMTYSSPIYVKAWLKIKQTGEIKEQDIFMGDFHRMTPNGTFVINGAERVVVSQLLRSPGVYFTTEEDIHSGRQLCFGKLIPSRGAWLEFETSSKDLISVKVDRKRKIPITTLLRAIGYGSDEELVKLFKDVDTSADHTYIRATIEHEPTVRDEEEALIDFYRRLRPGDPATVDNARGLVNALFFNPRRYDLGKVGRYKLNKRLGLDLPPTQRVLTKQDLVEIVCHIIKVNNGLDSPDDIDHLGNRRVRAVGELIQNQFRVGLLRMERVIRERMSIIDTESSDPRALINIRPVVAAMREFFGSSQLSQFMDQTNPLAELTHKRRLSALGPGGLSREYAGFDVRDVHHSHYGRICPIETPEGPNIGLIGSLATYGRINEYGFIETPCRRVIKEMENTHPDLVNRTIQETLLDAEGKIEEGTLITAEVAQRLAKLPPGTIKIKPYASNQVEYLSADKEEHHIIAQANALLDQNNRFVEDKVEVRQGSKFSIESPDMVDFMDVSPKQIVSVATSLIPFLEHDDANRALMGSNMQRQAVPLLHPESPLIGTGMEQQVAQDSGHVVFADTDGLVTSVTATEIIVNYDRVYPLTDNQRGKVKKEDRVRHSQVLAGDEQKLYAEHNGIVLSVTEREIVVRDCYFLMKFRRSNQGTCINHRPLASEGDQVRKGQALADSSATDNAELALGQNVLCAFMSWEGYNFEDAIIISESLVREDKFTSIHIEKHECEARDTKLGKEETTRDIPNVGEESLRDLDEEGIIRIGAEVGPGDILVGKITPKGETELSAEEKLLRAIFGEKAREVKDTSLRVPHGERGKVIEVRVFDRGNRDELPPGVNKMVRVCVAQKRKIAEGDKMAGRHGNKGVIASILPPEDLPFLPDGRPIEIILNPIGVPSRMNIGQVLETHLGWAAQALGFKVLSPVFDGADDRSIEDALARAWIAERSGALSQEGGNREKQSRVETAKAWLAQRGYDGDLIFNESRQGEAKKACLRLWLEDMEIDTTAMSDEEVEQATEKLYQEKKLAPPIFGKTILYDGRTGEPFDQPITVGYIYMLKLIHLVEDKIHARSTGPYSLITQQPLGGKAQFGGQRFGEMEVWALESYGAAHNLREMLTVKSDDVVGRVKTYEAIVKGEDLFEPELPESFKVLIKELQSLGLSVELLNEDEEKVMPDSTAEVPDLGINLAGMEKE